MKKHLLAVQKVSNEILNHSLAVRPECECCCFLFLIQNSGVSVRPADHAFTSVLKYVQERRVTAALVL